MFDRGTRGSQQKKKISPTVQVPGHGLMYKSTLTSLLNENPTLSHDRLVCVRQRATQGAQQAPPATSISLYDDYAVYEKDTSQFIVGKLQRMRKKGNRGYIEYRQPLRFDDTELKNIETIFQVYSTLQDEQFKYTLDETSALHICKASDVLCCLDLTYCSDDNLFTIAPEAVQLVTRSLQSRCSQSSRAPISRARDESIAFDGRITRVVEPGGSATSNANLRRSTRRRTLVEHV